jgi:integrase
LELLTTLRAKVDADLQRRRDAGKSTTEPIYVLDGARGKRQQAAAAATFGVADFRAHDLRRTAASMMASAGVARLVIGKVLNHVERGVTAIYDRHSYDAEKRLALDHWDRLLRSIVSDQASAALLPFVSRA